MYLCLGRSMAMASMAMTLRNVSGFVGPLRATGAKHSTTGVNVRCWMSATASGVLERRKEALTSSGSVFDVQDAELKAERLWDMADAREPVAMEGAEVAESKMEESAFPGALEDMETEGFMIAEGEISALRRYQYSDQLVEDSDSGGDDGKEYYI